jgi:hypothetical protein
MLYISFTIINKKATVPITNDINVKWSKTDVVETCNNGTKEVKSKNQKAGMAKTGIVFLLNKIPNLNGVSQKTQISIATTMVGIISVTTIMSDEIPKSIQFGILAGIILSLNTLKR